MPPIFWCLGLFEGNLFFDDSFFINFSIISRPWFSPEHDFMGDYPYCEIVSSCSVVFMHKHLGGDVAWLARSVRCILRLPDSCEAKICKFTVSIGIKNNVFWSNISVQYTIIMQKLETEHQIGDNKLSLFFIILEPLFIQMGSQISTFEVF